MFKSIFSKYFAVVAVVVLSSFVALCGAQTLLSSRYWTSEKRATLCQSAETVAAYTAAYTHPNGAGYISEDTFNLTHRHSKSLAQVSCSGTQFAVRSAELADDNLCECGRGILYINRVL